MNRERLNKEVFSVNDTLMIITCILFLLTLIFVLMYGILYFSFECACDTACYNAGYRPFNETAYLNEYEIVFPIIEGGEE